jgi:hypothetical protein
VVSRDDGHTFGPRRPIPHPNAFMIAAATASTIVAATGNVGGSGPFTYTLELSTDGGVHWRTIVREPETLTAAVQGGSFLAFASSTVGHWIGYPYKLWTTNDAGRRWAISSL